MQAFYTKPLSIKPLLFLFIIFSSISLLGQDLSTPFNTCKAEGSITIFDYNAKKWITSDSADSQLPTLPASTFKIVNTLIALETGVIHSVDDVIGWPGTTDTILYGFRPEIYHDMSVRSAFQQSAGWAYIEMAKEIGKARYQQHLNAIQYGNGDLSEHTDDFWNFGNFAVSPVNQIETLIKIHEENLPFMKTSFTALKEIMIEEQSPTYTLRAKTGWTRDGGKDTGWWVGYVERADNVYFFATRIIKDRTTINPDFGRCRKAITKEVLTALTALD